LLPEVPAKFGMGFYWSSGNRGLFSGQPFRFPLSVFLLAVFFSFGESPLGRVLFLLNVLSLVFFSGSCGRITTYFRRRSMPIASFCFFPFGCLARSIFSPLFTPPGRSQCPFGPFSTFFSHSRFFPQAVPFGTVSPLVAEESPPRLVLSWRTVFLRLGSLRDQVAWPPCPPKSPFLSGD